MSTKTIIIGGCSWTAGAGVDTPWPDFLKGYDNVVNVGRSGASNTYIFNSIIDEIEKHKDEDIAVFALWTDSSRINVFSKADVVLEPQEHLLKKLEKDFAIEYLKVAQNMATICLNRLREKCLEMSHAYEQIVNTSLRTMWLMEEYCRLRDIEFYHGIALNPLGDERLINILKDGYTDNREAGDIIREAIYNVAHLNPYYNYLDVSKKFMGFKFDMERYIYENKYEISENDCHPNVEGHKHMAKIIEDFIETGVRISHNETNFKKPVFVYD
jgi:hypothetical protein